MDYISLCGIAVGLSMDAFAVSVTNGAVSRRVTPRSAFRTSIFFGLFQAVMPTAGWLIGKAGESFINSVAHWIALILLGYIGTNMIVESRKKKRDGAAPAQEENMPLKTLLTLAVATSIDALATGVILPASVGASTPLLMLTAVLLIGCITFCISYAGVFLGRKFGALLAGKAEVVGGIVLIVIGLRIFLEHYFPIF